MYSFGTHVYFRLRQCLYRIEHLDICVACIVQWAKLPGAWSLEIKHFLLDQGYAFFEKLSAPSCARHHILLFCLVPLVQRLDWGVRPGSLLARLLPLERERGFFRCF